jgi:ElaB/YqjD/DUF883 family membrane-anchored ribosome-binding protein
MNDEMTTFKARRAGVALLVAAILGGGVLAGCGNGSSTENTGGAGIGTANNAQKEAESGVESAEKGIEEGKEKAEKGIEEAKEKLENSKGKGKKTFEEAKEKVEEAGEEAKKKAEELLP